MPPTRPLWQIAGKRDPEQEREAQEWLQIIVGEGFPDNFENSLRSGVILCKLMNKLHPGIIQKIALTGGDYKMMDNISQFHRAAIFYGVPEVDLFSANDLWEQKNMFAVTQTIFAIGRACYRHPEFKGPYLGPPPATQNRREFTEEQLRAGESIIGLQAGNNKGATQTGQNFGAGRKIILGK